jgi:LysM repeat protein
VTAATTVGGVLLLGSPALLEEADGPNDQSPQIALVSADHHHRGHRWSGHPGRWIVRYTVKPGDTATGLAVRFHAWTDELLAINHLTTHSTLYVGERIKIPVVLAALHKNAHHRRARHARDHDRSHDRHPWRHEEASRARVRAVIVRKAERYAVNRNLALAISWQEAGWQQYRVSSAHAIGTMQVIPSTGRWMSQYVGRRLNLYGLYDNTTAGVVLIKVLRNRTSLKHTIAGYYQGLGSVRAVGMYHSTRAYVANVLALKKRIAHGWNPS